MKISIVTPSYNGARFLSEAINSVISQQGDFYIEYTIVDNCSSDGSVEILNKYEKNISKGDFDLKCRGVDFQWISEPDSGMYDAVNKGFSMATGDVYAYINTDDFYLPGAFDIIVRTFDKYPHIKWLKGITSYANEFSTLYEHGECYLYHQPWIRAGIYGREAYFIQQDSVFWRSDLWHEAGGFDVEYKLAGDYYLWVRFSQFASLYSLKALISCFRKVEGQLSCHADAYREECAKISSVDYSRIIRAFFAREKKLPVFMRSTLYRLLFNGHLFNLVELTDAVTPQLRTVRNYVV